MEPYTLRRTASTRITLRMGADESLRVSAPWLVPRSVIDRFVQSQEGWIRDQRAKRTQEGDIGTGQVLVWGRPFQLEVVSPGRLPRVVTDGASARLILRVPVSWGPAQRRGALERWEKGRVEEALAEAVPRWERVTGLKANRWTVKRLRSRWGSCNPTTGSLVFNARLGAFPSECLEYVIVHELAHLLEPSHNARFHALVDRWFPGAPVARALLRTFERAGSGVFPGSPAKAGEGREPPGPR
jgi:predicted metal-dependent hydrolase